ncbi:hypothetical protein VTK73DRAFT_8950 [Phialemonium thermophilum]|uniref:Apopolysialoglycoprotein n=1 Tax=Phialemonium thermophilum TaxID=223376 RepID=A0ABR3Y5Q6_9PEZI
MAPTYRIATQTRRGNRAAFPEHDDFEGLPVRQWRQEWVNVVPPPPTDFSQQNDRWAIELPYGMPKDWQLLPPHSQELLRAARSGRLYKRPAPPEEEEAEIEGAEKTEKRDETVTSGFGVRLWKQIPRNVEGPAVSHLAKRHKHTITLPSKNATTSHITGPTVTRATVRRIDAAGNPYDQTISLVEGQRVDGEIISTTIVPAPSVPNTEASVQQPTPIRRRPPPPKRKAKGPGRGRRKGKLPLPASQRPVPPDAGNDAGSGVKSEASEPTVIKTEESEETPQQDSEMVDNSALPSDDDENDEGEGDEGDEGEDEEGEMEGNGDEGDGDRLAQNGPQMDGVSDDHVQQSDHIQPQQSSRPSNTPEARNPSSDDMQLDNSSRTNDNTDDSDKLHEPSAPVLAPSPAAMNPTSPKPAGSPLKSVTNQSPTGPSPSFSPGRPSFGPLDSANAGVDGQLKSGASNKLTSEDVIGESGISEGHDEGGAMDVDATGNSPREAGATKLSRSPCGEKKDDLLPAPVLESPGVVDHGTHTASPTFDATEDNPQGQSAESVQQQSTAQSSQAPVPASVTRTSPDRTDNAPTSGEVGENPESELVAPETGSKPTSPPIQQADEGNSDLLGGLERELDRQAELNPAPTVVPGDTIPTEPTLLTEPRDKEAARSKGVNDNEALSSKDPVEEEMQRTAEHDLDARSGE